MLIASTLQYKIIKEIPFREFIREIISLTTLQNCTLPSVSPSTSNWQLLVKRNGDVLASRNSAMKWYRQVQFFCNWSLGFSRTPAHSVNLYSRHVMLFLVFKINWSFNSDTILRKLAFQVSVFYSRYWKSIFDMLVVFSVNNLRLSLHATAHNTI